MVPVDKLKLMPIFKNLSDEYLEQMARILHAETYQQGEMIFNEGTTGNALYIVGSGRIEIRKTTDVGKSAFKTLAIFEKNDCFGEMSLLEDKPRSASAYAGETSEILTLKRDDFLKLLQSKPRIAVDQLLGLLCILSDRLRQTSIELTTLYELGQAVSMMKDTQSICRTVMEKIRSAFAGSGRNRIWIALWNQFNEEFDIIDEKHEHDITPFPVHHPMVALVRSNNEGWFNNDASRVSELRAEQHEAFSGMNKIMIAPLKGIDGALRGFICTGRTRDEDDFRNSDCILLSAVSSFTATVLMNISFINEELQRVRLEQGKGRQ